MSLLHLLIENKQLDIMVNKIGVSKELANEIQKNHSKKFQFVVASIINNDWTDPDDDISQRVFPSDTALYHRYERVFERMESFLKENNFPKIDLNRLKIFNYIGKLQALVDNLQMVKDYREGATPTPQLSNMSVIDAIREAERWHIELKASGKSIQIKEGQVVIHEFKDGYYWLDLKTTNCDDEGDSMGHCGFTDADTLLSLRDKKGEPHVTVAYDYKGIIRQMKGKLNEPPVEKYHPYIVEMFDSKEPDIKKHKTPIHIYQFVEYDPEYKREDDFSLLHLSQDLLKKVHEYMDEKKFHELFYDMFDYKKFVYDNEMVRGDFIILEDLSNIFPFEDDWFNYTLDGFNDLFHGEYGSGYIVNKFIEHSDRNVINKLKGTEFITSLHHINIDENETDDIADALIKFNEFYKVDTHLQNTSLVFIFAK